MSQFKYNDIELALVKTNSVERTPRLSDDRVDYMWTDFVININCIYNPGATSFPDAGTSLPPETDVEIRHYLMQPRRPLLFAESGIPIINIETDPNTGITVDLDNGPTPLACNITRISPRLFSVNYVIKTSIMECPTDGFIDAVASVRYSRTENIDAQFRSTMMTSGKAYFRSNILAALQVDADAFRGYIIPPPILGFRRKSVSVNLAPNGTMIEFMVIDEEQFVDLGDISLPGTAASVGIVEMDLNYSTWSHKEGAAGMAGMGSYAKVDATAIGSRVARNLDMVFFLFRCIGNKLGDLIENKEAIVVDVSSSENIFKKIVNLSMTYFTTKPKNNVFDLAVNIRDRFENGVPLVSLPDLNGVNPQPPFSNMSRGVTPVQLAARSFATSCVSQESICWDPTGTNWPPDLDPGNQCFQRGIGTQVVVYSHENPENITNRRTDSKNPPRSVDNRNGSPYPKYMIKSQWFFQFGGMSLPIAAIPSSETSEPPFQSWGNTPTPTPTPDATPTSTPSSTPTQGKPTSITIQAFQPQLRRVVSWVIERIGAVPEIPSPDPRNSSEPDKPKYTLLDASVSPMGMELMPDAFTLIYKIAGVYTYACSGVLKFEDSIPFDVPPWVDIDMSDSSEFSQFLRVGGNVDFSQNIINWNTSPVAQG